MNNKIINLYTSQETQKNNSKSRLLIRTIGWTLCLLPAGAMGFIIGGIFGMACALSIAFLFALILDSIFSKKLF